MGLVSLLAPEAGHLVVPIEARPEPGRRARAPLQQRDAREVERDGARQGVRERRAVVLRRERVVAPAVAPRGDGGGHGGVGDGLLVLLGFGEQQEEQERHGMGWEVVVAGGEP